MLTNEGDIKLSKEFYAQKTLIVSKSGGGKSYSLRVIVEEGVKQGNTFLIIDPQEAYLNLPGFAYINAKNVKDVKGLAKLIARTHKNTVISTKHIDIDEQNDFLNIFLRNYRIYINRGIQTIVIDEAHKYCPESASTAAKTEIRGLFQENRSDGVGCIALSQRVSRLDKTVVSQADNLILGHVNSYRDKEALRNYLPNKEDVDKLADLEAGEFFFSGFGNREPLKQRVRTAETKHSGNSPENLLTEIPETFDRHISKFVKRGKNMDTADIIPDKSDIVSLTKLGLKISLGTAAAGIVGAAVSGIESPIELISTRTLGSGATALVLYGGSKIIPVGTLKESLKYGAAGAMTFTAGSLLYDICDYAGFELPGIAMATVNALTGALPLASGREASIA